MCLLGKPLSETTHSGRPDSNHLHELSSTGGSGKERGTNKLPPTRRIRERSKGERRLHVIRPTNLPESFSLKSILAEWCMCHQEGPWVKWLARDNQETNPITIKPKTVSHVAEQSSWVPLPSCSPPRCPFPIESLALSACVSLQTIHFRVLDKSPSRALEGVSLPATCPWLFIGWVLASKKKDSFFLLSLAIITGWESSPFWSPNSI